MVPITSPHPNLASLTLHDAQTCKHAILAGQDLIRFDASNEKVLDVGVYQSCHAMSHCAVVGEQWRAGSGTASRNLAGRALSLDQFLQASVAIL